MDLYAVAFWILVSLTGMMLLILLKMGDDMDKFTQAIARLQDSTNKSNAKIDSLIAGQDAAVKAGVDAALSAAADQLNGVSDSLDSKNQ